MDMRIDADTIPRILDTGCDVLADCIDTIACKSELIRRAVDAGMPVFSSMGMAMRRDPLRLHRSTLDRTSVCPVARNLRRSLRDIDMSLVNVVYSDEEVPPAPRMTDDFGKGIIGSVPMVPMAAGAAMAQMVIEHLIRRCTRRGMHPAVTGRPRRFSGSISCFPARRSCICCVPL